jgi:tetratricopeptide (TPR) repeat protein
LADDPIERASLLERGGEAARAAGHTDEARDQFERSIEAFESGGRVNDTARVSARLAEVLWDQGHIEDGLARMEASFEVLKTAEPNEDLATLAAQIGRLYFFSGDMDRSIERLDFGLRIAEHLFLPEVLSHALNTKSLVLGVWGRPEEARALLRHAITIAQEHGVTGAILRGYFNSYLEPEKVLEYGRLGLELARRLGNRQWELNFLGRQASTHWMRGDWDEALAVAQPLLEPANWQAGMFALSRSLPALTHLLVNRGEFDEADQLVALRKQAATSAGLVERADYLTALAMLARARGDLAVARQARDDVLAIIDRMGIFHETTRESVAEAIEISLALGEIEKAVELVEYLKGKMVVDHDYLTPQVARFEPRIAAELGDHEGAEEGFQRALRLVERSDSPFMWAAARVEYAEWLIERGRPDEAGPLLISAKEIFERLRAKPWVDRIVAAEPALGAGVRG